MTKFIIAALAASIIVTPAMAAPSQNQSHNSQSRVEQRHDNRAPQQRVDQHKHYQSQAAVRHAPQRQQVTHRNWKKGDRVEFHREVTREA